MSLIRTRIADLKIGDIVHANGGKFRVIENARESVSHRPMAAHLVQADGPSDCAVAKSVCIEGEVRGYFKPEYEWTFQGATSVTVHVEPKPTAPAMETPMTDKPIPCSVSDDDLCSGCEHFSSHVQCGEVCAAGFPAQQDADGYVVSCIRFAPFDDTTPYDEREAYARCSD